MGARHTLKKDAIFFDGVCNLCNGTVNFVIKRDSKKRYKFASLQSEIARDILPNGSQNLESIVLLKADGKLLKKSDAALEIARHLKGAWFLLYGFKIIPTFIRNWLYDIVAKNRYKWFGKKDECPMPTPELKERFLETS